MMINSSFSVDAPPDQVCAYLLDVNKVVGCVPGAELGKVVDSKTFSGKLKVKVVNGRMIVELPSDVLFATADSSPSGMGAATLVPDQVAAFEREGEDRHAPKGRGPTEKAKAKGRRTRREKDDAAAEERASLGGIERLGQRSGPDPMRAHPVGKAADQTIL